MKTQGYHVHVYKLESLAGVVVYATDGKAAREMALKLAKDNMLAFGKPDNEFLALEFLEPAEHEEDKHHVAADSCNAVQYIGRRAVCSKGLEATITGISKMPWGIVFVGFTDEATAWCSHNPEILPVTVEA